VALIQATIACWMLRTSCILLPNCRWVANPKACSDNRSHLRELNGGCFNCLGDLQVPRSLVHIVPRARMLDEHHFRSLGKLVVGNLDRIADVDNIRN
jgi:hypothetical protein